MLQRLKQWIQKNERWLSPAAIVGGFVIDNLTIRDFSLNEQILLLVIYLGIVGGCISISHAIEEGAWKGRLAERLKPIFPLIGLFTFGSLFSAFLIFYSRDASLVASWPFILFLAVAFLGTELFKKYQARLTFQVSLLYFSLFSFSIFIVPVILKAMGPGIFFLSSLVSLVLFAGFLFFLYKIGPERFVRSRRRIIFSTLAIFCAIQFFYFTNTIPPVPLALKDVGVYHQVSRAGAGYQLSGEKKLVWFQNIFAHPIVHLVPGKPLYVFSSVFAPTALNTKIVHVWQKYDETSKSWTDAGTVSFAITGGRDGGYRGYSMKAAISPGRWRVNVETSDGLLIGRVAFTVEQVTTSLALTTEVK